MPGAHVHHQTEQGCLRTGKHRKNTPHHLAWEADMGVFNMEKVFTPASIAVIGASQRDGSIGNAIMRNLVLGRYTGRIFPVNGKYDHVWSLPCFRSLEALEAPVDLAVIATPIYAAVDIVRQCVDKQVGGVVIISAGGKEIGPQGTELEQAIRTAVGDSGLRIIGPNCLGIMCAKNSLNVSFARQKLLPGKIAFISQSGAIGTAVLDKAAEENIGFSHFISLGSMLDVDFGDMIDYLGGDPAVGSIVMYVESLVRLRTFMSAARAVSRVKPVIILKAGRTAAGAAAAASHTGAMAGEDAIYDAAFARAGIVRVNTFEELFDCADFLAKVPRPRGPRLCIVTNAGGPGVMAVDALSDYQVAPAVLSSETIDKLNHVLPAHWSRKNPVDIIGDAPPERFRDAARICMEDRSVDGLLLILAPQAMTDPAEAANAVAGLVKESRIPVLASWMGGGGVAKGRRILDAAGIATYDTPERAVRAYMNLCRYSKNIAALQIIPSNLPRRLKFDRTAAKRTLDAAAETRQPWLRETDARALLSAYGIPMAECMSAASADDAAATAERIGFPVALKIDAQRVVHKSDVGGVRLGLGTPEAVLSAYREMTRSVREKIPTAVIHGVTVQPMVDDGGIELLVGAAQDRDFGPVILFGLGGIFVELFHDRAIGLPPLNRLLARQLVEKTRAARLLAGYRNVPPADMTQIEEVLIRLSQLVTDFPEICELDINPLMVTADRVLGVDARVRIGPAAAVSPLHLIISPYPRHWERHVDTAGGLPIFVRPIRPEDAPLLEAHFRSLSPRSVYMRFFSPIKRLSPSMLARFTQIDYDREIALVAIDEADEQTLMGVARIITERDRRRAEFSVVVGDPWQGQGIGAELLRLCLAIAPSHGITEIWGTVLSENTHMLKLAKKLGFAMKRGEGGGEFELFLNLTGTSAPTPVSGADRPAAATTAPA
jgi:acetyltransferase